MPTTKTAPIGAQQAQNLLNKAFHFLEEIHNQPKQPQASELEKMFTRNFELFSNGNALCHNLNEYASRVEKLRSKFSKIKFSIPHEEPITSDHRVVTHYSLSLTPRAGGQPINVDIMAIATFEGDRLSKWQQVVHEKGTSHWDK